MKKVIFLDVDGTLFDMKTGVPNSAQIAIKKARENGNKVYLSTGRAKSEIHSYIWDIGFDGMVASAGAYVESDGKVIFHQSIAEDVKERVIKYLLKNDVSFILEATDGIYVKKDGAEKIKSIFSAMGIDDFEKNIGVLQKVENILEVKNVNKLLYYASKINIETLKDEFKNDLLILPSSILEFNSGEISDKNINKSTGMQKILDSLGMTREDIIAYGDSANDIEMLQFAGIGVAMGNAIEDLKMVADEVTDSILEDGIYNSFKRHNLI